MLWLVALLFLQDTVDPAKALKSKDAEVRLAAVRELAAGDHEDRSKLLIRALKDEDWEVAELAAEGLGTSGEEKALKPLVELALEGPVRRLRRAAAAALGRLDAEEAFAELAKKVAGKHAVAACEGLAELADGLDGRAPSLSPLEKALKSGEGAERAAAGRALVRLAGEERAARLATLLADGDVRTRAAALEAAGASGDASCLDVLRERLVDDGLADVLVRRLYEAQRDLFAAHADDAESLLAPYRRSTGLSTLARARHARLFGKLGEERGGVRAVPAELALEALRPALDDGEAAVRVAAAGALRRLATDAALDRALALAGSDPHATVRLTALDALVRTRGGGDDAVRALAIARLGRDDDARVRELAAVALAVRGAADAAAALVAALDDTEPAVAQCAAVSLGLTGTEAALGPLVALAADESWARRGAALVGLTHLRRREAMPAVLAALEDPEPLVRRTAREYLRSLANRDLGDAKAWRAWWDANGQRVRMSLSEEVLRRRRELGYATDAAAIYRGLDVVVLQDIGDHIESVLAGLDIEHRLTRAGQIADGELHPDAVFVSNCPGKINGKDRERLAWFVRVGGYLMGSCWAVSETIGRIYPGMVRRLRTDGEVLDEVLAEPCSDDSPFLEGVFPPDCRPIYQLEGAHLIEVVDRERVEVLIDSPECADRWGGGNLAAWFPAGHGLILDSVNHFDLQGFSRSANLKKPEERMAYAVDHMGLSYERLRALREERFWRKNPTAAAHVKDLSAFRLITNFVRHKRASGAAE